MGLTVNQIDWSVWQPQQRATLLFVIKNGSMLLIHKKRGLGAGKINAPGGRLESGETSLEAAIRETREELGIEALDVSYCGDLSFQFLAGLTLFCQVFKARDYRGDPHDTSEATPLWVSLENIPYERMWQDDRYWLPVMLKDQHFKGYFIFDQDRMLDYRLDILH
ncbi:8-oxo-dGTP diphosphatase [bacterium]|nr:8-oxo-dGTP diphosphatase [bacterium]